MINQYKRLDVFRCSQEAHRHFKGRVSVYHVMKEKGCFPQGCIYFDWHCVLMEKGSRCIHGYQYTGKNCKGCTYFMEEKIHLQPELLLTKTDYEIFLDQLEDFENWLEDIRFRRRNIAGQVSQVKPWYEQALYPRGGHIKLRGYLIVIKEGFIGNCHIEDTFYIRISEGLMKSHSFVPKMKFEMNGEIREDRGRIVIHRPQRIEVTKPGWGKPLTREHALVAAKTATLMLDQPDQCLACRWGALIDVIDRKERDEKRYRRLYCLKSIAKPEGCYIRVEGSP